MKSITCPKCGGSGKIADQAALGKELRSLRMKLNVSLREMAMLLKISPPFLSDMELGKRNWSPDREHDFRLFCGQSKTNNKKG